jgi:hypothetical protein
MKRSALLFLHLTVLVSGCVSDTGYLVHFRSQEPFRPGDPNELLAELTGGLPAGIEIQQFLYHRRPDEMRGVVLVRGARARDAVRDAIHGNPRLAGVLSEKAHAGAKSMICFASQPSFAPADENEMLAELRRGLPPGVQPTVAQAKRAESTMTVWVLVNGNFGREAVKFAIRENPNLKLLQVGDAPPLSRLMPERGTDGGN